MVTGDKYSHKWVRQAFQAQGIRYLVSPLTASDAFLELLPLVNQGSLQLLDDTRQTAQLIALERRKTRMGKDSLSHPPGEHDDRANALAHAAVLATKVGQRFSLAPFQQPRYRRRERSRPYRPFPAPPVILDKN